LRFHPLFFFALWLVWFNLYYYDYYYDMSLNSFESHTAISFHYRRETLAVVGEFKSFSDQLNSRTDVIHIPPYYAVGKP
jgi:hypothetical protein